MNDPKISYYLKSRKSELREVILKFSFGYKTIDTISKKTKYVPLLYNTKVKVSIDDWDSESSKPGKASDLAKVEDIKEKLESLYKYLRNTNAEISPEILKIELDDLLNRKTKVKRTTNIIEFINEFVLQINADTSKKNFKYAYSKETRKAYKVLIKKIVEFEEANNIELTAENIDRDTFLAFQKKCQGDVNKNNAAWGVVKNLKATLRKIKRKYKKYNISVFDPKEELDDQEKISFQDEDKIYFEFPDINRIIAFDPDTDCLKNVKLILLTLIFSGARYSDVFKVKPEFNYSSDSINFRYAHFITTKSPSEVVVPFLKPLEDAIKQNNGKTAYPISAPKFNKYVKELCRQVGFNETRRIVYTNSEGVKKFDEKNYHDFVSSHVGRRTFISNFINVVPATLITKVTGHKFNSKDVVFKYNKISSLKGAVLFMKFIKNLSTDDDWKEEFPLELVR